jgi:RHS repeat-associated protein
LAGDLTSDTNTTNSSTLAFNAGDELCWFSYGTYSNSCASPPSGAVAFSYNNDGERTAMTPSSGNATTFAYNQAQQFTSVTTGASTVATYAYDGTGERTTEIAGGTTYQFAYNTTTSTPEILSDGQNSYLYGPSSTPIEQISNTGVELYLHHDALGSVRRICNQAGVEVAAGTYNSYGGLISGTGSATTPFQYAGAYTDPVTGFQYLNNRYYDPSTGQFITQDPDVAQTGQPYEYAADDPRNNTDPTGLSANFFCAPGLRDYPGCTHIEGTPSISGVVNGLAGLSQELCRHERRSSLCLSIPAATR